MSVVRSSIAVPLQKGRALVNKGGVAEALSGLAARCFAQVDVASIVTFRIAFGLIMFWEVFRYFDYGWIARYWIVPPYNFPYVGFEWVTPWPGIGMYIHFYALGFLALCIALGWWYRVSTVLFFLGFTYGFLLEKANYLNHFYFVILISFLMIFVPANRALSVDALTARSKPAQIVPIWAIWILRFQMSCVYVFGGLAKLNGDWLQGEPMRPWLLQRRDFPLIGRWFHEDWMVNAFVYGGVAFDLLIVPALLWRRTRWLALGAAAVFHFSNDQLFQIGIFPWLSLAATVLFFPPELPRRVVQWFRSRMNSGIAGVAVSQPEATPQSTPRFRLSRAHGITLAAIGIFVAVQIFMPLRHHLYAGDVTWTEEGHRYSWRMKLRSKGGSAHFLITAPEHNLTRMVDPYDYLTARQVGKMASQPDMLVQFSHYLADQMRAEGYGEVEVRVMAMISLNGRDPQVMIDPDVDLAAQELTFAPKSYILPNTAPLFADSAEPVTAGDAIPMDEEVSGE